MKVCLVTPELPPYRYGGIGMYTLTLARGLFRLGLAVDIVGVNIHGPRRVKHEWGQSISLGTRLWDLSSLLSRPIKALSRMPVGWRISSNYLKYRYREPARLVAQYFETHADRYDVVETPNYLGLGAYFQNIGVAPIVRLSTPASLSSGYNDIVDALESNTYRSAALIISNSKANDLACSEHYRAVHANRRIIAHGLEDTTEARGCPPSDRVACLFIGRADRRKGIDVLLRAFHRAYPHNKHIDLSCLGCTRAEVERYLQCCEDGKSLCDFIDRSSSRIRFLKNVSDSDKESMLASAHVAIIPSRYESFGLVAVEALRAGTPFIAADVGGLGEIARTCEVCEVFANESDIELARILSSLRPGSQQLTKDARNVARTSYLSHYTSGQMIAKTLEAYHDVVDSRQ